ncbi:MAG: cytidine deaminase [Bdellovibrionales bacterium]|nr:cytidine deaminase [Bdellovibrionales bacterium]
MPGAGPSTPARLKSLHRAALAAQKNAYSPYSGARIGAALVTGEGLEFSGCNVENSSYGGTVCAERVAVQKAVSEGARRVKEIVIVSDANPPWPPCGFCRQVLMEFAGKPSELRVHLADRKGIRSSHTMAELLPMAFTPSHLSPARGRAKAPRAGARRKK